MAQSVILIFVGIIWLIYKVFEGVSNASSAYGKNQNLNKERKTKYSNRVIDSTKSLFARNLDIIDNYANTIDADSYRSYYLENKTRDCINEICIAEGAMSIRPESAYLNSWMTGASRDWVELSYQIQDYFSRRRDDLRRLRRTIDSMRSKLRELEAKRINPSAFRDLKKTSGVGDIMLTDLDIVLTPNEKKWRSTENDLLNLRAAPTALALFEPGIKNNDVERLNKEIVTYNESLAADNEAHKKNSKYFSKIFEGYRKCEKESVISRINYILNDIRLPESFPKIWEVDFDPSQSIAIVEISLPDVVHRQIFKEIQLKLSTSGKPLNQKETKEFVPNMHPAVILRVAYEIFANDDDGVIKLLVVNGWVEFDDPKTGNKTKTYTASLVAEREQILVLNLRKLDPLTAFINLKGKTAGKLIDIIPVTPTMSLNKRDKRFIETKEVLDELGSGTNLAAMDWQDFESLIAELFEKEFADKGAEVKVTQASRDRGVDAIVFDPDPIKGGKFIIQAKRYTNTVDVSAVRDLCAVVEKEGASRGILVTTSSYGTDAYAFAQNEPITLLNGAELLGLLSKHGYKFRINLAEAKRLNVAQAEA